MTGVVLLISAISLALLFAATIFIVPVTCPAREAIATVLILLLVGVSAVLIGGYRE